MTFHTRLCQSAGSGWQLGRLQNAPGAKLSGRLGVHIGSDESGPDDTIDTFLRHHSKSINKAPAELARIPCLRRLPAFAIVGS